jgi:hypothetical protein
MKNMTNKFRCQRCGIQSDEITPVIAIGLPLGQITLCPSCGAKEHADTIHSLEEADSSIADVEDHLQRLESLLSERPQQPDCIDKLQSFAMTPLKVYRQFQYSLAALKVRRVELRTAAGSRCVLEYELKQSLEKDDYETASQLRDRLQQLDRDQPAEK